MGTASLVEESMENSLDGKGRLDRLSAAIRERFYACTESCCR